MRWSERGRLALNDEGYLWLMPVAGDEDTLTRRLGHVEGDPRLRDDLVSLEPDKDRLTPERLAGPTRRKPEPEWREIDPPRLIR